MKRRLTVSQIVGLLFYKGGEIVNSRMTPEWILSEGKRIHDRLGFNQPQQFRRYILAEDGQWWLIIGDPDKVDQEAGLVAELKTYRTAKFPSKTLEAGILQVQIYCWLTGLPNWEIWGYSSYSNNLCKKQKGVVDEEFVRRSILKAIKLKGMLEEFSKTYKEVSQGGDQDGAEKD